MSLGTPLHVAAELEKTHAVHLLVQLGADPGVKDANGRTALEWAQKLGKMKIAQLLEGLS